MTSRNGVGYGLPTGASLIPSDTVTKSLGMERSHISYVYDQRGAPSALLR